MRKVLLTYWNTVSFLVLYANAAAAQGAALDRRRMRAGAARAADRPVLDRWLLSELHTLVRDVTAALEGFDSAAAGRRIAAFIDDLSNWYVRRSRRRFWEGPGTRGRRGGLRHAVRVPGDADQADGPDHAVPDRLRLGRAARPDDAPESVHLASWPAADAGADRRAPVRADGARPAAGRARPLGARRRGGAGPPAAGARAHRRARLRRPPRRPGGPGGRRAQRARAGHARRRAARTWSTTR